MGKGKGEEKRRAYTFLAHALGPVRISQVADYQDARKKLSQGDDQGWDLLYVETQEKAAETAVFKTPIVSTSASRKRKRGPATAALGISHYFSYIRGASLLEGSAFLEDTYLPLKEPPLIMCRFYSFASRL
ncbi:hypothetical protein IFR05_009427 [Cadophora sp. M221]|nr:hypothetical protein IFR05_009427 [Cadophora sp. M221]